MKKTIKKALKCALSLLLAVAMLSSLPLSGFKVNAEVEKTYVKDVMYIYAEDLEEAKTHVPEGYVLLETDLNQGAEYVFDVDDVYMAYLPTSNPEEAITDIKMMNMYGGFSLSDYKEQINNVSDNVKAMATELECAADAFVENYRAGKPGAKAGYRTLSVFTVDEVNMSLADYLLSGKVADDFYLKLLMNSHKNILSTILSALTMAVQGDEGDTWLDRLAAVDDPFGVDEEVGYWDKATALLPLFLDFYESCHAIDPQLFKTGGEVKSPDDGDGGKDLEPAEDVTKDNLEANLDDAGAEVFYEICCQVLDQYSFGSEDNIKEWLVCDYIYEEMLYPLVSVMTDAEYAMMHLCGPLYMILSTGMSEDVYNDFILRTNEIVDEIGSCSVWRGVNVELFRSSIGITDEAARVLAETQAEQELTNDGDSGLDTTILTAGLLLSVGAIALGVGLVLTKFLAVSFVAVLTGSAASTSSAAIIGAIVGVLSSAVGVVLIVVAIVIAIVYLVIWLVEWYNELHPDYTEIPEYMYDVVVDEGGSSKFVLYEAAKFQDGTPADVNAWEGKEWHAPFISRDKAAGNPIEADFKIKLGNGLVDEGYAPLSTFGKGNAENMNQYAFGDDVDGIYVSFRQEPLKGNFASGKYLSDVRLFTAASPDLCKMEIKDNLYTLLNINLTPDMETYTYLGYKTTDNASRALTDIRLVYNYDAPQYSVGGGSSTYAASGSAGPFTLYSTRIDLFGSPILADLLLLEERNAPEGYEPVNFFAGGPAINLNYNEDKGTFGEDNARYLYFLPSVTYTEGEEYIGGIATFYDGFLEGDINGSGQMIVTIPEASKELANELGYEIFYETEVSESHLYEIFAYTTTHNPYRAIYGIGTFTTTLSNGSCVPETFKYRGGGYSLSPRFALGEDVSVQESWSRHGVSGLYIENIYPDGKPLTPSDIIISGDKTAPSGFKHATAFFNEKGSVRSVSENLLSFVELTVIFEFNMELDATPAYVYVREDLGKSYRNDQTYVTNVFVANKAELLGDNKEEIDCEYVDNSYLLSNLGSLGATEYIDFNVNYEDDDNMTLVGLSRNAEEDPLTNLLLCYMPDSAESPKPTVVKDKIIYYLAGRTNLYSEQYEDDEKYDRVYLYYTRNPDAGEPIRNISIDMNPFPNNINEHGWETVRTVNGKSLHEETGDMGSDSWYIHVQREDKKYIKDIFIGIGGYYEAREQLVSAGCTNIVDKDLNDNVGAHSDYIFLGYTKTNNKDEAIRDLRTTHDDEVGSFTQNGATYYKIEGNLNSWTNIFADDIFLYYTKDKAGGDPLVRLYTAEEPENYTIDQYSSASTVVNQDNDSSDLNDGAAGDYIYLIQVKDAYDPANITKPPTQSFFDIFGSLFSSSNFLGGAMLGTGSIIAILSLSVLLVSAGIVVCVVQKKHRAGEDDKKENEENEGK